MARLRRLIGPIAAAWLVCQAVGVTAVPLALAVAEAEEECTCGHGDHAICPMHHRPTAQSRCAIRATHDADTSVLSTLLLSSVGVPVPTVTVTATEPSVSVSAIDCDSSSLRPAAPEPPPPRA